MNKGEYWTVGDLLSYLMAMPDKAWVCLKDGPLVDVVPELGAGEQFIMLLSVTPDSAPDGASAHSASTLLASSDTCLDPTNCGLAGCLYPDHCNPRAQPKTELSDLDDALSKLKK